MKNHILCLAVMCIWLLASSVSAADYDFRNVSWRMSQAEVERSEERDSETDFEEEGITPDGFPYHIYSSLTVINDKRNSTTIEYRFVEDKLFLAQYKIDVRKLELDSLLPTFDALRDMLSATYGSPSREERVWSKNQGNKKYKEDPELWGGAIAVGRLEKFAFWKTERMNIKMHLKGDNYDINVSIQYESTDPGLELLVVYTRDKHLSAVPPTTDAPTTDEEK